MIFVGIDPGVRCTGIAWIDVDGAVVGARIRADVARVDDDVLQPFAWDAMGEAVQRSHLFDTPAQIDHLVLEIPQVYARGPGDDNDLISGGGVLGAVMARLRFLNVVGYRPHDWKRSTPKDVMTRRLRTRFAGVDLTRIPASLRHNALDAVGLAMHHAKIVLRRVPELAPVVEARVR